MGATQKSRPRWRCAPLRPSFAPEPETTGRHWPREMPRLPGAPRPGSTQKIDVPGEMKKALRDASLQPPPPSLPNQCQSDSTLLPPVVLLEKTCRHDRGT